VHPHLQRVSGDRQTAAIPCTVGPGVDRWRPRHPGKIAHARHLAELIAVRYPERTVHVGEDAAYVGEQVLVLLRCADLACDPENNGRLAEWSSRLAESLGIASPIRAAPSTYVGAMSARRASPLGTADPVSAVQIGIKDPSYRHGDGGWR